LDVKTQNIATAHGSSQHIVDLIEINDTK